MLKGTLCYSYVQGSVCTLWVQRKPCTLCVLGNHMYFVWPIHGNLSYFACSGEPFVLKSAVVSKAEQGLSVYSLQELKLMKSLDHRNIVRFLDIVRGKEEKEGGEGDKRKDNDKDTSSARLTIDKGMRCFVCF